MLISLMSVSTFGEELEDRYSFRSGSSFTGDETFFINEISLSLDECNWTNNYFGEDYSDRVELSIGSLTSDNDQGFYLSVAPTIERRFLDDQFSARVAAGVALISKQRYNNHDFGGPNQFIFGVGLTYHITDKLDLGYYFHHMSDGYIYDDGVGINSNMVELSYTF